MVSHFTAALQKAQGMGMSAERAEQLEANVAKSGKIGASLSAAKEYIARLEEKIKAHYRRPSDDQPPPDAVIIPPLTAAQYAAMENWNVAAQIATWAITIGLTAGISGAIGSRGALLVLLLVE